MIGSRLITKQTGAEGQQCQLVLVHEAIQFERELYFAILMDRAYGGPVMVASKRGGMDIEEVRTAALPARKRALVSHARMYLVSQVAAESPGDIYSEAIDILKGLGAEQAKKMALRLGFEGAQADDAADQMVKLYRLFIERDATQVEINPFVVATNGKVYCVDAKINFDDNAAFRQQALFAMRDKSMEDPREVAASEHSLNYIGLDGNIGCMVNGAGLAMATMDIIKLHGGLPANFLDVGGGANEQQVEEAFKILTKDPRVKAILVNIFGGIMKCDIIATGIVNAARKIHLKHPLVVRLAGTNVELGNKILRDSGLSAITASNLDDAAKKAVLALSAAGKP
jgi:succinyl-CoA synthetase beta subunit